jgi:hypothetical protein
MMCDFSSMYDSQSESLSMVVVFLWSLVLGSNPGRWFARMLQCHDSFLFDSLLAMAGWFFRGFPQLLPVVYASGPRPCRLASQLKQPQFWVRKCVAAATSVLPGEACVRISWPICASVSREPLWDRRKMAELRNFYIQMQEMISEPCFAAVEGPGDRLIQSNVGIELPSRKLSVHNQLDTVLLSDKPSMAINTRGVCGCLLI